MAFIFGLSLPGAALSESSVRVTDNLAVNDFYAEFAVIADHPQCARASEIAFRVPFDGEGLAFIVHDPMSRQTARIGGAQTEYHEQCTVTRRAGTETQQVIVPCEESATPATTSRIATAQIAIDLQADITICMSPTGYTVLDGPWSVTTKTVWDTQTNQGASLTSAGDFDHSTIPLYTPYGIVQYDRDGGALDNLTRTERNQPLTKMLNETGVLRVGFRCIPVVDTASPDRPLLVSTFIRLFLVDEPQQTCVDGICPQTRLAAFSGRAAETRYCPT